MAKRAQPEPEDEELEDPEGGDRDPGRFVDRDTSFLTIWAPDGTLVNRREDGTWIPPEEREDPPVPLPGEVAERVRRRQTPGQAP